MHAAFAAAVIAGTDKFSNRLTVWEHYLDPRIPKALGVTPRQFMHIALKAVEVLVIIKIIYPHIDSENSQAEEVQKDESRLW